MEQQKFKLSADAQKQLRFLRQQNDMAAESVSEKIGKSKAWLAQVERGTVLSIKKEDLVKLLLLYTEYTEYEILYNGVLDNFVNLGQAVPNAIPLNSEFDDEIAVIGQYFSRYLKNCSDAEEYKSKLTYIHFMIRCLEEFPKVTEYFFENFFLLYETLDNYESLNHDQFLYKTTSFMKKINTILKDAYRESQELE